MGTRRRQPRQLVASSAARPASLVRDAVLLSLTGPRRRPARRRSAPQGGRLDRRADRGLPRPRCGRPALCAVPPRRLPRAAPRGGCRSALGRRRPRRRLADGQPADRAGRLGDRGGGTEDLLRCALGRPRRRDRRRATRPTDLAVSRATPLRPRLDRHGPGLHAGGRSGRAPRLRHAALRATRASRRPAAHPAS